MFGEKLFSRMNLNVPHFNPPPPPPPGPHDIIIRPSESVIEEYHCTVGYK